MRVSRGIFEGWKLEHADFGDGGGQFGDVDADGGSLPFAAFDVQLKIFAVEDAEALADVAEADAFDVDVGHFFFGDADPIVGNFDLQAAVFAGGAEEDAASFELRRQAVFQAVFDHGLEQHAGDEGFESHFVDFFDDVEVVVSEASNFDIEIVVDEGKFFAQGHEGFVLAQEAAEDVAELQDNAAGGVGIDADKRGDRVQSVEEEVRIDLAGERVHPGAQQELLVAFEVHLDAGVVPDFQRRGDGHQRGDEDQGELPVPVGIDGEEPLGLGGFDERDAAEFKADTSEERQHLPHDFGVADHAHQRFGDIQKGERAEIPERFLVGNYLTN